jgi:hypothetical protein
MTLINLNKNFNDYKTKNINNNKPQINTNQISHQQKLKPITLNTTQKRDSKSNTVQTHNSKSNIVQKKDSKSNTVHKHNSNLNNIQKHNSKSNTAQKQNSKSNTVQKQNSKSNTVQKKNSKLNTVQKKNSKSNTLQKKNSKSNTVQKQNSKSNNVQKQNLKSNNVQKQNSKSNNKQVPVPLKKINTNEKKVIVNEKKSTNIDIHQTLNNNTKYNDRFQIVEYRSEKNSYKYLIFDKDLFDENLQTEKISRFTKKRIEYVASISPDNINNIDWNLDMDFYDNKNMIKTIDYIEKYEKIILDIVKNFYKKKNQNLNHK